MTRIIEVAAVVGMVAFISEAAHAQAVAPAPGPTWLTYESHSDLYPGPAGGLFAGTSSTASVNLGAGLSVSIMSSSANSPGSGAAMGMGGALGMTSMNSRTASMAALDENSYARGNPMTSSVGGRVSMDLGSGMSASFIAGVRRGPGDRFTTAVGGPSYLTPGGPLSGSVGAGLSMDLGHGSSFSISGGMSKSSAGGLSMGACNGLSVGLCR
jgi:hypothetical protein